MAFSEQVIKAVWNSANGRCQCTRKGCGHEGRCNKQLVFENHKEGERGAWEAHHKYAESKGGQDTPANCEILCLECHKNTKSYGRSS